MLVHPLARTEIGGGPVELLPQANLTEQLPCFIGEQRHRLAAKDLRDVPHGGFQDGSPSSTARQLSTHCVQGRRAPLPETCRLGLGPHPRR